MWQNARDAYLESRILAAEPLELVRLLYHAAIDAVQDARRRLAAGQIVERSRAISKASEIVLELAVSLDYERGGELSQTLGRLYAYIQNRLTESNLQQSDAPLAEVLGLLSTLSEGWNGLRRQKEEVSVPQQNAWASFEPSLAASPSHGWSL
jgi:flagellar protein FliS